ncbi:MAG TPA: chemotaxis protein CheB [Candidatus Acidoferrales bacterium]|nr:chemotaxis protein CheB [Candidatus Acidoferrales bacterium]
MRKLRANGNRSAIGSKSRAPQGPTDLESRTFPVVGIGASAGGLEAFTELLRHLPEKVGMAYVLVQHLDPTHGGVLQEILARATKISVSEVTDGQNVQRDHIYVIPANANMTVGDGVLRLVPRESARGRHMPIDYFLRSLAEDRQDQAIAVILSGTASDGTLGCGAVKTAGGITFAQDEGSAKYSGMPRSAIDSGSVDFVLPPKSIAQELVRIGRRPYIARATPDSGSSSVTAVGEEKVDSLLAMLRQATGVDFSEYKQTTLQRRIKRRMVLHRLENLEDYLSYIKQNPNELVELYRDVLINVTGFFRDPTTFEALRNIVFPTLLQDRPPEAGPLRFWVPGCSTGEEAYSIAMVLTEYLWDYPRKSSVPKTVQIFATDISDTALDHARIGLYSEAAISDVTPERLKRFFLKQSKGFQVNKSVREMCIFAKQNVAKDPPFSNLDLVSCRNLLIYLGPALQRWVIPALHYALRPNGYLMLGGSETLGAFSDQFNLIDKKSKIYRKKPTATRLATFFAPQHYEVRKVGGTVVAKPAQSGLSIEREVDRLLVNRFVPASIVVNDALEIVQFRGKTGAYLEPAAGQPTFSLSKMAREGLLIDLREALIQAKKQRQPVRKHGVRIKSDGGSREIDLEVIPIRGQTVADNFYIIVFQEALEDGSPRAKSGMKKRAEKLRLPSERERAEREIKHLREQLQALIEDHETTLEEYKSTNEEVLSTNEELQSTNEELETAKEELQSTNEELTTLNEELQNRNSELSMSNNDMVNLLSNVSIPVVMVGDDLRIRRFTPLAEKLMNYCSSDIGRSLAEIRPNLVGVDLDTIVRNTIETATPNELEVQTDHDRYLMRVRPYKTWNNKIEGAVITFLDIDAIRLTLEETRRQ